jgi:hypothetical protein
MRMASEMPSFPPFNFLKTGKIAEPYGKINVCLKRRKEISTSSFMVAPILGKPTIYKR